MTWQRLGREFEELRAEYRRGMPAKIARLDALWSQVSSGNAERRGELIRELHTIAGSAGSFGLPAASVAARAAENHLESASDLDAGQRAEFARLLDELRRTTQPPD